MAIVARESRERCYILLNSRETDESLNEEGRKTVP